MALGRISGPLLKANLLRDGVDLAVETDLLYFDVSNSRLGVKTATPGYDLHVAGTLFATNLESDQITIDNILLNGNTISSTVGNLTLQPATGTDQITVSGNMEVTGDLTIGGNITLGDADTDGITLDAEITSDIVPDASASYNLGSATKNWNTIWVSAVDSETEVVSFNTNGAITLPVGTTAQRPSSLAQGMIRYNTDDARFEAYNGTVWTGIGGAIIEGDLRGSVFGDDSSLLVDGIGNIIVGDVINSSVITSALYTPLIDTQDSSTITIVPAVIFNSDITVENDIVANNKITANEYVGPIDGGIF